MVLQKLIFKAPQIQRDFQFEVSPPHAWGKLKEVVEKCQWDSFLDSCVVLSYYLDDSTWKASYPSLTGKILTKEINTIFSDNSIGYELRENKIEKIGPPFVDKVVAQVRQILEHPDYGGPNEQFEKAISFLNQLPNPDTANCVKDAIGAVEGLARIVSGNNKLILSKILDSEQFRSEIPATLREMIQKLYAYRGDAEGVGHGQTSKGQIPIEEAELALGASASCMIYLAKKFGKEP
jgi:hypothetical protein